MYEFIYTTLGYWTAFVFACLFIHERKKHNLTKRKMLEVHDCGREDCDCLE